MAAFLLMGGVEACKPATQLWVLAIENCVPKVIQPSSRRRSERSSRDDGRWWKYILSSSWCFSFQICLVCPSPLLHSQSRTRMKMKSRDGDPPWSRGGESSDSNKGQNAAGLCHRVQHQTSFQFALPPSVHGSSSAVGFSLSFWSQTVLWSELIEFALSVDNRIEIVHQLSVKERGEKCQIKRNVPMSGNTPTVWRNASLKFCILEGYNVPVNSVIIYQGSVTSFSPDLFANFAYVNSYLSFKLVYHDWNCGMDWHNFTSFTAWHPMLWKSGGIEARKINFTQ